MCAIPHPLARRSRWSWKAITTAIIVVAGAAEAAVTVSRLVSVVCSSWRCSLRRAGLPHIGWKVVLWS